MNKGVVCHTHTHDPHVLHGAPSRSARQAHVRVLADHAPDAAQVLGGATFDLLA